MPGLSDLWPDRIAAAGQAGVEVPEKFEPAREARHAATSAARTSGTGINKTQISDSAAATRRLSFIAAAASD